MKTIFVVFLSWLLLASAALCQTYHQPAEILKILADSKVSYQIGVLEIPDLKTIEYPPEVEHGLFLKKNSDGGFSISRYDQEYADNKAYAENLRIAEKAFSENKLVEAREAYLKVLAVAPFSSQAMTFIGQTYATERNDSLAAIWYRIAIDTNYFDYMAHWFLADVYEADAQNQKALSEILIAKVLNRNNPRLSDATVRIFAGSDLKYAQWDFSPHYELKDLGNNKVSLKYDQNHPEWLSYALCKAVWQFEPGYRESMLRGTTEHPMLVEEKECVVNLLIGLQNAKRETNDPALQVAQKALQEKMFNEFLVYEVILPRYPLFVFNLSQGFISSISNYVLKFRAQ